MRAPEGAVPAHRREKEVTENVISVRKRKEGDKGQMTVADFLKMTVDDRKVVR